AELSILHGHDRAPEGRERRAGAEEHAVGAKGPNRRIDGPSSGQAGRINPEVGNLLCGRQGQREVLALHGQQRRHREMGAEVARATPRACIALVRAPGDRSTGDAGHTPTMVWQSIIGTVDTYSTSRSSSTSSS